MEYNSNGDGTYTITCTSTGAPPTDVVWMRNDLDVTNSDKYIPSQRIVDRASATYDNVLTIKGSYEDAVGDYICNISNYLSYTSTKKTVDGNCWESFTTLISSFSSLSLPPSPSVSLILFSLLIFPPSSHSLFISFPFSSRSDWLWKSHCCWFEWNSSLLHHPQCYLNQVVPDSNQQCSWEQFIIECGVQNDAQFCWTEWYTLYMQSWDCQWRNLQQNCGYSSERYATIPSTWLK